jgi:hypothetical protein
VCFTHRRRRVVCNPLLNPKPHGASRVLPPNSYLAISACLLFPVSILSRLCRSYNTSAPRLDRTVPHLDVDAAVTDCEQEWGTKRGSCSALFGCHSQLATALAFAFVWFLTEIRLAEESLAPLRYFHAVFAAKNLLRDFSTAAGG